jgi:putative ABC transport system permease protein
VLAESYPDAEFTISDAGSKMKAANKSNRTLTLMLIAMASIVFIIGGIGIMNVLFVSVKERTEEIGILKAIGGSKKDILLEFMLEACCISLIGGILGVLASFAVSPVITSFSIRMEMSVTGALLAMGFSLVTGTIFGFYPAWKASRLVPVEALSSE